MISLQNKLAQLGTAFGVLTERAYHYWRTSVEPPYLIWAESGEEDSFHSDDQKAEQAISGTVDVFTRTEFDPLLDDVQDTLEALGVAWSLSSVQFEEETNLIHYEWSWTVISAEEESDG